MNEQSQLQEAEEFRKALHQIEKTNYKIVMPGLHWWAVLTHLQSALKHPQAKGVASEIARRVSEKIASLVANKGILKTIYERDEEDFMGPGPSTAAGPTGHYPAGKLSKDDEGEFRLAITADKSEGIIRVEFGKKISWLAMTPKDCRKIVEVLERNIEICEKAVV